MYVAIVVLHIILCVVLIFVILLQPGKDGNVGASFGGGGGGNIFGARGPTSLLAQVTTIVAVMFMGTSITLAWFSNKELLANRDTGDAIELLETQRAEKAALKEKEAAEKAALESEGALAPEAPATEGELAPVEVAPVEPAPQEAPAE